MASISVAGSAAEQSGCSHFGSDMGPAWLESGSRSEPIILLSGWRRPGQPASRCNPPAKRDTIGSRPQNIGLKIPVSV